jgi:hypothetical protein
MSETTIGRLERVPVRELWEHEALHFTPWLEHNLDILNDVLDLNLSEPKREQAAGDFSVDLIAEDGAGNTVVIENQLGRSDHDHLGKLITYLTYVDAKVAIWIVSDPRPEHVRAVSWLNESSESAFYLVKLELVRVDDSLPAPLLTVIVRPSEELGQVDVKKDLLERHILRRRFWESLLEKAKEKTPLHANISPGDKAYIATTAGKRGLRYNYGVTMHGTSVALYIDRGQDLDEENKAIFDEIQEAQGLIEEEFGEPLEWHRLDGRRASIISKALEVGGYRDEEWEEAQAQTIELMIRFEKALRPHVAKIAT